MEIEIRAKVNDLVKITEILQKNAMFKESSKEDDLYLRHANDTERLIVLRIRRKEHGSILTFKGKSKGHDTAWPDVDLPLSQPDELEHLLLEGGYVKVVRIHKNRSSYQMQKFEINLDEVVNLGYFIEVEGRGAEDERGSVEERIIELLKALGIQEADIIKKGYVGLMLEKREASEG